MNKTNMIIIAVICVYLIIIFPKIKTTSTGSTTSTPDVSNAPTATGMNNKARSETVPTMNGFTA